MRSREDESQRRLKEEGREVFSYLTKICQAMDLLCIKLSYFPTRFDLVCGNVKFRTREQSRF